MGSHMAARYLALYGRRISRWYEAVDNHGLLYDRVMDWFDSEELYKLRVYVETGKGWQYRASILGGGPYIAENKVYSLDISDVTGDTLRIKLMPPIYFWEIDHVAVGYSTEDQVTVTELEPAKVVTHCGEIAREPLSMTDGTYLIMHEKGEWAEIDFTAPTQNPSNNRTILLKASGYYTLRLPGKGTPKWLHILRMLHEPGFAHRYALEVHEKIERENWRKIFALRHVFRASKHEQMNSRDSL
jgi:hypothetical protein